MENNKQKLNLAYKAHYGLATIAVSIIVLAVIIACFCTIEDKNWFIYLTVLTLPVLTYLTHGIFYFALPKVLVKYDDTGIYIYQFRKRESFIKYGDITDILAFNYNRYTSGKLHIATRDNSYNSFTVEDVTKVAQTVYKLKKEHGFPDLDADKKVTPAEEYLKRYKPLATIGKTAFIICILTASVVFSVYFDKWGLTALLGILVGFGGTFAVGMTVKALYLRIINSVATKLVTADGTVISRTILSPNYVQIKNEVIFKYKIIVSIAGVNSTARTQEDLKTGDKVTVVYNPNRPHFSVIISDKD